MMRARYSEREGQAPRTNTAFGHNEDNEQYRARIRDNVEKLTAEIRNNPDTAYIVCQEAPIRDDLDYFKSLLVENLPDNWPIDRLYIDDTNWGVVTLINLEQIACERVESIDLTVGLEIDRINERCRTVKVTQAGEDERFVTNLHLPHDSPEEACKGILYRAIKHKMMQPGEKKGSHTLCGDWNIQPDVLSDLVHEVLEDIKREEGTFDAEHPVSVNATIYSSPGGHLKADGSKLSVDASLLITFEPSSRYDYSYKSESFDKAVGMFFAMLASAGIALFSKDDDLEEALEVDSNAPILQKTADLNAETKTTEIKQRLSQIKTPNGIASDSDENKNKP